MARARGKGNASKGKVRGVLELVGLGDQPRPELVLEAVDPSGKRKAIPLSASGEFHLDESLVGKGYTLELRGAEGGEPRRFAYDTFLDQTKADAVYRLPEAAWKGLLHLLTCVTGQVKVCRPIWPPHFPFDRIDLAVAQVRAGGFQDLIDSVIEVPEIHRIRPHFRCRPVCHGIVEVYLRTCCCRPLFPIDPPIIIEDLCKIIDCDRLWPRPRPWPWPEPDPGPFPGPRPGPGPDPAPDLRRGIGRGTASGFDVRLQVATLRALRRAESVEGAPDAQAVLRASGHLQALMRLSPAEQLRYIESVPDLRLRLCTCSTVKVAEVPLQEDGHFDACFLLGPAPFNCHHRVVYRVRQPQEGGWVVIYDGLARNESFPVSEDATLHADWRADACDDPHEWGPTPFVILEQIGNTWADNLIHSTQQDGETSFGGPLASTDGLVNPPPAGPVSVTAGPYNQPWGATLNLRYQFHPGLKGLGATMFRTRVVRVNANGNAIAGTEFTLTGSVSWRKYTDDGMGGVKVEWVSLNTATPGLYTIPYHDPIWPWLGGQWHAFVASDELLAGVPRMPNGRYLFAVDIFRADGKRLRPTNSLDPAGPSDVNAAFQYRRLDGPIDAAFSNTSVVPRNALASLFYVDNLACYGDIEAIIHNSSPSSTNCQFLDGPASDTVALQYSARHTNGFQWYHTINYKQGLTGPVTTDPPNGSNVSSGSSPAHSFGAMLGSETKCAFSAYLYVYARHTNGIVRLSGYDDDDVAAFALEITGP